jgi:hypothetical protein
MLSVCYVARPKELEEWKKQRMKKTGKNKNKTQIKSE